jgi:uncharacterized protein (TIGR03067 family)
MPAIHPGFYPKEDVFMEEFGTMITGLLVTGAVAFGALQSAIPSQETKAAKRSDDAKLLQGQWQVVDVEVEGKPTPEDPTAVSFTFTENGNTFSTHQGNAKYKWAVSKSAREIDITYLSGPPKNVTARCIYSLDNGEFKLCLPGNSGVRPKELTTKPGEGSGSVLFERKRGREPLLLTRAGWKSNIPGCHAACAQQREGMSTTS